MYTSFSPQYFLNAFYRRQTKRTNFQHIRKLLVEFSQGVFFEVPLYDAKVPQQEIMVSIKETKKVSHKENQLRIMFLLLASLPTPMLL